MFKQVLAIDQEDLLANYGYGSCLVELGQYQDAGVDLLINGDRNDVETRELFASDVMPHFV